MISPFFPPGTVVLDPLHPLHTARHLVYCGSNWPVLTIPAAPGDGEKQRKSFSARFSLRQGNGPGTILFNSRHRHAPPPASFQFRGANVAAGGVPLPHAEQLRKELNPHSRTMRFEFEFPGLGFELPDVSVNWGAIFFALRRKLLPWIKDNNSSNNSSEQQQQQPHFLSAIRSRFSLSAHMENICEIFLQLRRDAPRAHCPLSAWWQRPRAEPMGGSGGNVELVALRFDRRVEEDSIEVQENRSCGLSVRSVSNFGAAAHLQPNEQVMGVAAGFAPNGAGDEMQPFNKNGVRLRRYRIGAEWHRSLPRWFFHDSHCNLIGPRHFGQWPYTHNYLLLNQTVAFDIGGGGAAPFHQIWFDGGGWINSFGPNGTFGFLQLTLCSQGGGDRGGGKRKMLSIGLSGRDFSENLMQMTAAFGVFRDVTLVASAQASTVPKSQREQQQRRAVFSTLGDVAARFLVHMPLCDVWDPKTWGFAQSQAEEGGGGADPKVITFALTLDPSATTKTYRTGVGFNFLF